MILKFVLIIQFRQIVKSLEQLPKYQSRINIYIYWNETSTIIGIKCLYLLELVYNKRGGNIHDTAKLYKKNHRKRN